MDKPLTATGYDDDRFYQEHVAAGLDYLVCGEWHYAYARMVTKATLQHTYANPALFDGGCACGALLNAFDKTFVYDRVFGVDPSQTMINLGREKFRFGDDVMRVGSIDKIEASDASFTLVNTSQVMEHISDDILDATLAEFNRILVSGGRMFHHYDALKHGEASDAYDFDPTHVNIKPTSYWAAKFVGAGFLPDFESYDRFVLSNETLTGDNTSKSFFQEYRNWSVSTWIKP